MPKLLTSEDSHLLWTLQRNDNQNQRGYNDSSNDTTCTDLSSSQTLVVWASPADTYKTIDEETSN